MFKFCRYYSILRAFKLRYSTHSKEFYLLCVVTDLAERIDSVGEMSYFKGFAFSDYRYNVKSKFSGDMIMVAPNIYGCSIDEVSNLFSVYGIFGFSEKICRTCFYFNKCNHIIFLANNINFKMIATPISC